MALSPGSNVVQIFGVCLDAPDGVVRIVMELCAHGTLRASLQSLLSSQVSDHDVVVLVVS